MTEVPKPLDAALDLFVYAPVGLAVTAAEELPKLAAKGRTRVNTQLMMARVVGQFAVARGRQEFEKRFAPPAPPAAPPVQEEPEPPVTFDQMTANGSAHDSAPDEGLPGARVSEPAGDVTVSTTGDVASAGSPPVGELAIPGYDSLSASQVVQRLAGLDQEELAAVGAYEQAHRGRRTILNRIDQLQGQ
ncbi:MAG TPA: hypothetical protein VFH58_03595 [Acidimicrobiales bacterium]|nr:hypothetical protein [Acidimicrobiales bacterium]